MHASEDEDECGPRPGDHDDDSTVHSFEQDAPPHPDDAEVGYSGESAASQEEAPAKEDTEFIDNESETESDDDGNDEDHVDLPEPREFRASDCKFMQEIMVKEKAAKAGKPRGSRKVKRFAGQPPENTRQQMDSCVREKLHHEP